MASALYACSAVSSDVNDSVLESLALDGNPQSAWHLQPRLREISALAMSADQRLFAVDDERALIYEIDYTQGRINKVFAVGQPSLRGDFEGLAIVGNTFYLMTSEGVITRATEGADGDHVPYETFSTNLEDQCEFEGLAADPRAPGLLLLCKRLRKKADIDVLSIFAWNTSEQRLDESLRIELPVKAVREKLGLDSLRPSGLAVHPRGYVLVLVAAREQVLVEMDFAGELKKAIELPGGGKHPQAEGIEFAGDQQLIVADEGGKGRARLTVYGARAIQQEE